MVITLQALCVGEQLHFTLIVLGFKTHARILPVNGCWKTIDYRAVHALGTSEQPELIARNLKHSQ